MAQDAGEGLGIHAAGQRVSGEGVTQIMEPDVRQSCLFQQYLHPVVGGAGPHRLLRRQWVREDPLADGMFLPLLQPLDGAGRETDGAPAPFRFRFADLQFTPLGGIHRAEDLQCPGARIEVLPHETADLTSAQAGGQLRVEEVPPGLVLVHCRQEGVHLLPVQDLLGLVAVLGQLGSVRGVVRDDVIPFRVFETPVEHGMDAEHHGVRQLVSILRMVVDPSLFLQLLVQFLNIQTGDAGDDLAA